MSMMVDKHKAMVDEVLVIDRQTFAILEPLLGPTCQLTMKHFSSGPCLFNLCGNTFSRNVQ